MILSQKLLYFCWWHKFITEQHYLLLLPNPIYNIMENRTILYLFCFLILLTSSCSINKTIILETPFVTVVKLIDAEQALDLEDAKQYIDVIQVYTKLGSENPEEDWKKWSNRIFLIRFRVDWQRKCKRLHFRIFDICRRVTELHPSLIGCEDSCFCIMQINIKLIHHSFSQRLNI